MHSASSPAMLSFRPCQAAFTLVEVMIVVAIVALLGAIAVPGFLHYTTESRKTTCINNLRLIDHAIQQWALEQKKGPTASVDYFDIRPYLKGPVFCPAGGTSFEDSYSISTIAADAVCQKSPETHVWMGSNVELAGKPQ
jgi:prepilin-type N-terminal cleavage/methylation domain-containing protein